MTGPDVIDPAVFQNLVESVGGDMEFVTELLQTYFDDSLRLLAAMYSAAEAGNADELRRAAHSFKSNSASFGAMTLASLAKSLEDMGKAGALDGAAATIAQAEAEYARVRVALEAAGRP